MKFVSPVVVAVGDVCAVFPETVPVIKEAPDEPVPVELTVALLPDAYAELEGVVEGSVPPVAEIPIMPSAGPEVDEAMLSEDTSLLEERLELCSILDTAAESVDAALDISIVAVEVNGYAGTLGTVNVLGYEGTAGTLGRMVEIGVVLPSEPTDAITEMIVVEASDEAAVP